MKIQFKKPSRKVADRRKREVRGANGQHYRFAAYQPSSMHIYSWTLIIAIMQLPVLCNILRALMHEKSQQLKAWICLQLRTVRTYLSPGHFQLFAPALDPDSQAYQFHKTEKASSSLNANKDSYTHTKALNVWSLF